MIQSAICGDKFRILILEDHSLPLVAVNMRYAVGSSDDPPGRNGLAHLFEHLMFTGSAQVRDGEHVRLIQELGGVCNASTTMDSTSYYQVVSCEALDLVLWLEADRLHTLLDSLDQDSLDRQRRIVLNELRQTVEDQPDGKILGEILSRIFPLDHPHHLPPIGSIQGIENITLEDCISFFTREYRDDNAVLAIVGDASVTEVLDAIERTFGSPCRVASLPPFDLSSEAEAGTGGRASATVRGASPKLVLAFLLPPAGTDEFEFASFAASLLARGEGSRLMTGLVRHGGLLSDVKLRLLPSLTGPSIGMVELVAKHAADLAAAEDAYRAVLDGLISSGPTPDEIDRAAAMHEAHISSKLDTRSGLAEELTWRAIARPGGLPLLEWRSYDEETWRESGMSALSFWAADAARVCLSCVRDG